MQNWGKEKRLLRDGRSLCAGIIEIQLLMSFFKKALDNVVRLVNMVSLKKIHSQRAYFELGLNFQNKTTADRNLGQRDRRLRNNVQ